MSKRVLIVQPTIPAYRDWLIRALFDRYGEALTVFAGKSEPDGTTTPESVSSRITIRGRARRIMGAAIWQSAVPLSLFRHARQTVVLVGNLHYLNLFLWLPLLWLRRSRVLFWTHLGLFSGPIGMRDRIRLWFMRRVAGVLLYTVKEAELARSRYGLTNVFPLNNTVDTDEVLSIVGSSQEWRSHIASRPLGGPAAPLNLLFVGRVTDKARVPLLLQALAILREQGVHARLIVVGDGPQLPAARALASKLKVEDQIDWEPATYSQQRLWPYFARSTVFVYPGNVGLSLLHSFAYGLPSIIHDNRRHHNPEADALEPGINGELFAEGDAASLAERVRGIVQSPEHYRRMAENAFRTAHEQWSSGEMIRRYQHALDSVGI